MDTDAVIEAIASEMERGDFRDLQGILSKRKRAREDSDLRMRTRIEQRKDLAQWIRSYKSGEGNSYLTTLEHIQEHPFAWGPHVATALAARHATLTVAMTFDTHLPNCRPVYSVALTDEGRRLRDALTEALGEVAG